MTNYTGLIQAIKDHSEVITQLDELHTTIGATPEGKARYKLLSGKLYSIEIYISEEMQSIPTGHHAHILADEIWNNSPAKNTEKQEALKKALIDVLTLMAADTKSAEPVQVELVEVAPADVETELTEVEENAINEKHFNPQTLIEAIEMHCSTVAEIDRLLIIKKSDIVAEDEKQYRKTVNNKRILDQQIADAMQAIPAEHHAHTIYKEAWHGMPIKNTERENAWKRVLIDVLRNLPA